MKNLLTFLLTLSTAAAIAQTETYKAKDGTTVTVTTHDFDPDKIYHFSANLGYYGMEGPRFFELNYYQPTKFYINASAGDANYMIDGNIFFRNWLKDKNAAHTAKDNGRTRYMVKLPVRKRLSLGLHLGAGYANKTKELNAYDAVAQTPFTTTYALAGISLLTARHSHFEVSGFRRPLNLHLLTRINADVVYYFNRQLDKASQADDEKSKKIDDYSRQVGFRLYYNGRNSWYVAHGRLGMSYLLGVGVNANKAQDYTIFAGLGMFYAFGK